MERKYSVEEIDRMRQAIITRGEHPEPNPSGDEQRRAWREEIEQRLRTYMLAGTDPDELWNAPVVGPSMRNGCAMYRFDVAAQTRTYIHEIYPHARGAKYEDWHEETVVHDASDPFKTGPPKKPAAKKGFWGFLGIGK